MTKDKRGTKRLCESCGKRFYDLGKEPETCPLCEAPYVAVKPASKVAAKAPAKAPAEKPPKEADEEEIKATKPSAAEPEFVSLDEAAAEESTDDEDDVDLSVLGDDDDDDDIPDDDAEDVFLEDDEDEAGSDVKGIIGGPIDPKDEA